MTTADRLLEQMFSWIDQRSRCADQLVKLARELESLRHDCKGGERAPVIGDGFILVIEVLLGTTYLGVGAVISVATKLVEHFLSSSTMKNAKDIEEKSNKLAEDIQRLFEKLKSEIKEANRFANPDDLDRHILTDIMRAVARRSGVKVNINFRSIADEPNWSTGGGLHNTSFRPGLNIPILESVTGVLAFFTLKSIGTKSTFLFDKGAQQLITKISVTGMKTVLKGGGMLVGGAIGKAFALNEAIDSWTDLIKNNNVTEASQSLRDTAKAIRKISKALRDQFKDMKQMLEEMEEEQCEQAKVKRIIENPNRSPEEERELLRYAIETCQIKEVQQWWNENQGMETFINLVELFRLMKNEIINKSNEDKTNYFGWEVDIIFLAHGFITQPTIPAFCLRPWSNIQDVLLYSPWNCLLGADAAYGIATGLIQPGHRRFVRASGIGCKNCYEGHRPRKLPLVWNSMKEAGLIPIIMVSTITDPQDGAWTTFVDLTADHGTPQRCRILVPFILGGWAVTIPFFIVTWVMSLVLFIFGIKATVHLAACLGDRSTWLKFPREFLEHQYSYTVDNTVMTAQSMWPINHPDLYRKLRAMFN